MMPPGCLWAIPPFLVGLIAGWLSPLWILVVGLVQAVVRFITHHVVLVVLVLLMLAIAVAMLLASIAATPGVHP